jgi:N-acetylglucosamine-6-phosphate deacetylase
VTAVQTIHGRAADGVDIVTVSYRGDTIVEVTRTPDTAAESLPVLSAGFIDLQVNGYAGFDVNSGNLEPGDIVQLTKRLALLGVTTWAPTVITASEERIAHALHSIEAARRSDPIVSAAIVGVHVEGPFISAEEGARGVHDPHIIRPLDVDEIERWLERGPVGLITVSPHTGDAPRQIARIRELGVEVAIGHTHSTPEQIGAAVDAGARFSTHLGNGISAHLPRHPNAIWTQLADDRLTTGLIADGHHLPIDTLEVMLRAKTHHRAFLVSDLTAVGGSAPGRYTTSVGGLVDLDASGRLSFVGSDFLAGAAATLVDGLRTVEARTTLSLVEAMALVTATPASVMPYARTGLGRLEVGAPADLVLFDYSRESGIGKVAAVVQAGRTVKLTD